MCGAPPSKSFSLDFRLASKSRPSCPAGKRFPTLMISRRLSRGASPRAAASYDVARCSPLTPSDGGIHIRLKDNAPVDAAKAVIACGAWSAPLARGLGDHIPLETERGYNTTLPPGSFDLRRQLTFGGHGFVITPLSSGIRVGGAVEFGGLAAPPNFARSEAMLHKAAQFLPGLKTDGGIQWMGCRPSLPDSLPVIGPSKATPNVIYAFGHGHLGLTQSAATGRLVADLVAQRWPSIDLAAFSPRRF
jgi:D-amino-acid dehydrogenase